MHLYLQKDKASDQIYIGFARGRAGRKGVVKKTVRVNDNLALDYDEKNRLLGIDIGNATEVLGKSAFRNDWGGDELLGVAEAAKLCGVRKPNFVRDVASREDFPKPVADLASGRVWWRSELEAYQEQGSGRPRPKAEEDQTMSRVLATILAADELAFRHNALTYFDHSFLHSREALRQPSIEEITMESIEEDLKLSEQGQSGIADLYVEAAAALFNKYSPSLQSYLKSVLSEDQTDRSREIRKATWIKALQQIQLGAFGPNTGKSFSRWLLDIANEALRSHGSTPPLSEETRFSDPLGKAIQAKRYEQALANRQRAIEGLRSERLVLAYLSGLSSEEILQFVSFADVSVADASAVAHAQVELERRLKVVEERLR